MVLAPITAAPLRPNPLAVNTSEAANSIASGDVAPPSSIVAPVTATSREMLHAYSHALRSGPVKARMPGPLRMSGQVTSASEAIPSISGRWGEDQVAMM